MEYDHDDDAYEEESASDTVRVVLRVRPFVQRERDRGVVAVSGRRAHLVYIPKVAAVFARREERERERERKRERERESASARESERERASVVRGRARARDRIWSTPQIPRIETCIRTAVARSSALSKRAAARGGEDSASVVSRETYAEREREREREREMNRFVVKTPTRGLAKTADISLSRAGDDGLWEVCDGERAERCCVRVFDFAAGVVAEGVVGREGARVCLAYVLVRLCLRRGDVAAGGLREHRAAGRRARRRGVSLVFFFGEEVQFADRKAVGCCLFLFSHGLCRSCGLLFEKRVSCSSEKRKSPVCVPCSAPASFVLTCI